MKCFKAAFAMAILLTLLTPAQAADDLTRPISASADGHFLTQPDGEPFFWLGDTAWELFHKLTREETDRYLQHRAHQGFNVIQTVATGKLDTKGLVNPNRYGEAPFIASDPARPNPRYFEHIDWVVDRAAHYGVRVALLPAWGGTFVSGGGPSQVFTVRNAEQYGRWLAQRYRGKGIIWVLGGDITPIAPTMVPEGKEHVPGHRTVIDYRPVYDAMARGIAVGEGGHPFITYHPSGASFSGAAVPRMSLYFSDRDWFGMSMLQSSHFKAGPGQHGGGDYLLGDLLGDTSPGSLVAFAWNGTFNYLPVGEEYRAIPPRPVIDAEPRFEEHPIFINFKLESSGFWRAHDVRGALYQALFAGAAGHTYGHVSVWDFYDPARRTNQLPGSYDQEFGQHTRVTWQEALNAPGGGEMRHAKALMLSRPYFMRIPDQSVSMGEAGEGEAHIGATRDRAGSYAMIYLPQGQAVTVDLTKLSGMSAIGWWFDPRSGQATRMENTLPTHQTQRFTPPTSGPDQDWVLVIDDASKRYPPPGSKGS